MKYKAVIWDLDGTLLDTLDDLKNALNHTLQKRGYEPASRKQVRERIGNGVAKLIARSIPEQEDNGQFNEMVSDFFAYYRDNCCVDTTVYPGILQLLEQLREKGIKNAIVTNKFDAACQKINRHYLNGLIDYAIGEKEGIRRKPDRQSVDIALKALDVSPGEAVYIGDSEVDIMTGHNSDMKCISVSYGFRDRQVLEQAGADVIVDSVEQLADYLMQCI